MSAPQPARVPRILHVEDNPADIEYAQESCVDCGCVAQFDTAIDGHEAIEKLSSATVAGVARPDLILLDLNLPRVKGHEVLAFIRGQPALRGIPVVILTSSTSPQERRRSLELGATDHVQKPTGFSETRDLIAKLQGYVPQPLD